MHEPPQRILSHVMDPQEFGLMRHNNNIRVVFLEKRFFTDAIPEDGVFGEETIPHHFVPPVDKNPLRDCTDQEPAEIELIKNPSLKFIPAEELRRLSRQRVFIILDSEALVGPDIEVTGVVVDR